MSINQNARELTWKQIEEFWFYDDLHFAGHRSHIKIPTLKEWFNEFQNDSRLKLIWLDVKANGDSIGAMARSLSEIIPKFLVPKIQFSANADGNLLDCVIGHVIIFCILQKTECCFNESCHDWV